MEYLTAIRSFYNTVYHKSSLFLKSFYTIIYNNNYVEVDANKRYEKLNWKCQDWGGSVWRGKSGFL